MRLGVIARADDRGLGNQTWEVVRNLHPERVLVVRVPGSEAQGFTFHADRFPGATIVTVDEKHWTLHEATVREWLHGLDVVYSAETLYDWRLADWAREAKCATVVHANPEFYTHWQTGHPEPTRWWSATDWRIDHLPPDTVVVPMPAPVDRFPTQASGESILHIGGRAATGDRNGTDLVLEAARLTGRDVTVATQTPLRNTDHVEVIPHTENWWELYDGHGILLLPRRYGGLCLPAIEACAAGLVPVMPDVTPNRSWPVVPIPAKAGMSIPLPAGNIESFDVSAESIARTLDDLDVDKARAKVAEWASRNSWEAQAPRWLDELDKARTAKPHRSTTVTVVVPFTPGDQYRDAAWAWLKAHWSTHHPGWRIVEANHAGEWSKGAALADAVAKVTSDVVIVADADCLIAPAEIRAAVARASLGAPWVVPHTNVLRLDEWETHDLLATGQVPHIQRRHRRRRYYGGIAGGGMVVLPRRAWDTVPMDPRFVGWGYEDVCWGAALDTLVGPHVRLDAELVHLWHPPQAEHSKPRPESETLYQQYLAANNLPRRMRAVIDGGDPELSEVPPVTFRANCSTMKLTRSRRLEFADGEVTVSDPDLIDALRRRPDVEEVPDGVRHV